LARKWVVDSIVGAARIHWELLMHTPAGTQDHLDDVERSLGSLVSWISAYFKGPPDHHGIHINEAADSVACLAISCLNMIALKRLTVAPLSLRSLRNKAQPLGSNLMRSLACAKD